MVGFRIGSRVLKLTVFSLKFLEILLNIFLGTLPFKGYKIYRIEILEKRTKMVGFRNWISSSVERI